LGMLTSELYAGVYGFPVLTPDLLYH